MPTFVHAGTRKRAPWVEEILSEVDMGLAGIEAGIKMSKADGNEMFRAHDIGGTKQSAHRKLHGGTFGTGKQRFFALIENDPARHVPGRLKNEAGERNIVGLSRTQHGKFVDVKDLPRDHHVRSTVLLQAFRNLATVEIRASGDQNELFAALLIRQREQGVVETRKSLGQDCFDGGKGNHLTGYFGESLGAANNRDEAEIVDVDDVAGIVPAIGRRFENAGIVGAQIAEHHIGALYNETAALFDSLHRHEPVLMPSRSLPVVPDRYCKGVLTESTGEHSVAPYPSKMRRPNFSIHC